MKKWMPVLLAALASLSMLIAPVAEARGGGHRGGGGGGPHFNRGGGGHGGGGHFGGPPSRSHMQFNQGARGRVHGGYGGGRPEFHGRPPGGGRYDGGRHDGGRYDHDDHHHHHHGWDDDDDWDNPFATAAAVTAGVALTSAVIGSITNSVPPGCVPVNYNGFTYQRCGNTWYQPQYAGPNVQYMVVSPPY